VASIRCFVVVILTILVAGPALADLSGEYEVVAMRRSSEVESTPDIETDFFGKTAFFGEHLEWIDGTKCDAWSWKDTTEYTTSLEDPNLSDVIIDRLEPSVIPDYISARRISLHCDNSERTVAMLVEIDQRVLVTSTASGALNVILQKPLTSGQISRLQSMLRQRGIYDGDFTGIIDDATRNAIARYADQRGAHYIFKDVVITENLLDGLGVLSGH